MQPAAGASKPATADKADEDGKRDALGVARRSVQREGRPGHSEQDVDGFSDADVGAAAWILPWKCPRRSAVGIPTFRASGANLEGDLPSRCPRASTADKHQADGRARQRAVPRRSADRGLARRDRRFPLERRRRTDDARIIAPAECRAVTALGRRHRPRNDAHRVGVRRGEADEARAPMPAGGAAARRAGRRGSRAHSSPDGLIDFAHESEAAACRSRGTPPWRYTVGEYEPHRRAAEAPGTCRFERQRAGLASVVDRRAEYLCRWNAAGRRREGRRPSRASSGYP